MSLTVLTTPNVIKKLSFYVIPEDKTLRKAWLSKISRKDFIPIKSHRVCSSHFEGGKKAYANNVPTIVPKTVKSTLKKATKYTYQHLSVAWVCVSYKSSRSTNYRTNKRRKTAHWNRNIKS